MGHEIRTANICTIGYTYIHIHTYTYTYTYIHTYIYIHIHIHIHTYIHTYTYIGYTYIHSSILAPLTETVEKTSPQHGSLKTFVDELNVTI